MPIHADRLLVNAEVHSMAGDSADADAIAIAEGCIRRVGSERHVRRLEGVETDVIDCGGRVIVPGFIDAHTHLLSVGRHEVHADLSDATSRQDALDRLATEAKTSDDWILGFGYDESMWDDDRLLTREDLDEVSDDRPVAAIRVDMHTASINTEALDRLEEELPEEDLESEDGRPSGVIVEEAVGTVRDATTDTPEAARELVIAARDRALQRGITCIHDMVRQSPAPRIYRDLDEEDRLHLRVRVNYWSDHFAAVRETGLRTNHGSEMVQAGAIKSFTDGAIGGRTARVSEPFADGDGCGQWVVEPEVVHDLVERVDDEDLQLTLHAIGDEAIDVAIDDLADTADPEGSRHRIEHLELARDEHIDRLAEVGLVASMQPNFLKWAEPEGLYDRRLGESRSRSSNRLRELVDAGVHLAFGSDCMPMDPLVGIHWAVNARDPAQRLTVDEAVQAYTHGAAYAGFDEHRLGSIESGKRADVVILERSPWEHQHAIDDIDVWRTLVDGRIVHPTASRTRDERSVPRTRSPSD